MIDISKTKFVSCRKCGTYTAFDKDVLGTQITCDNCQASFVVQEYLPDIGSTKSVVPTTNESKSSYAADLDRRSKSDSPPPHNDKTITTEDGEDYWSHEDYLSAYHKREIQVSVNHPAICSLCDSILEHTSDSGTAYRSSKLWFWLLPALSFTSFFVIGWFGIVVVIFAIGISLFKIGTHVRHNAYDCIIEASLLEPMVFRLLWGNEHLNIKKLTR